MEQLLIKESPYILLAYIVIKEAFPILKALLDKLLPAKIAARAKHQQRVDEAEFEQRAKALDIEEREVTARETIARCLILLEAGQRNANEDTRTIMSGVAAANQALTVLLDRNQMIRRSDIAQGGD